MRHRPSRAPVARPPLVRTVLGSVAVLGLALSAFLVAPAASAAPAAAVAPTHHRAAACPPPGERPLPNLAPVRWQSTRLVQIGVLFGPPEPGLRTVPGYLVGTQTPEAPMSPGMVVGPPGGQFYLPTHDSIVDSSIGGYCFRASVIGSFVVPGPKAPPGRVLTRSTPTPDDVPPEQRRLEDLTELAYAVEVGFGRWTREIPLTSSWAVEYFVKIGWLDLVPFDPGGTVWVIDRKAPFGQVPTAPPGPPPGPSPDASGT